MQALSSRSLRPMNPTMPITQRMHNFFCDRQPGWGRTSDL